MCYIWSRHTLVSAASMNNTFQLCLTKHVSALVWKGCKTYTGNLSTRLKNLPVLNRYGSSDTDKNQILVSQKVSVCWISTLDYNIIQLSNSQILVIPTVHQSILERVTWPPLQEPNLCWRQSQSLGHHRPLVSALKMKIDFNLVLHIQHTTHETLCTSHSLICTNKYWWNTYANFVPLVRKLRVWGEHASY